MLNSEDDTRNRTATWSEIPQLRGSNGFHVTDVWTGEDLGCIMNEYSVELESHDTAGLLVTGGCC
jgi:alpha-galactosidase